MSEDDWKNVCSAKKTAQFASIPSDWIIDVPSEAEASVLGVPALCGLLSQRELKITETTDVAYLLKRLHSMEWSSVEVTTAFYKRAVIAQQLVCLSVIWLLLQGPNSTFLG